MHLFSLTVNISTIYWKTHGSRYWKNNSKFQELLFIRTNWKSNNNEKFCHFFHTDHRIVGKLAMYGNPQLCCFKFFPLNVMTLTNFSIVGIILYDHALRSFARRGQFSMWLVLLSDFVESSVRPLKSFSFSCCSIWKFGWCWMIVRIKHGETCSISLWMQVPSFESTFYVLDSFNSFRGRAFDSEAIVKWTSHVIQLDLLKFRPFDYNSCPFQNWCGLTATIFPLHIKFESVS